MLKTALIFKPLCPAIKALCTNHLAIVVSVVVFPRWHPTSCHIQTGWHRHPVITWDEMITWPSRVSGRFQISVRVSVQKMILPSEWTSVYPKINVECLSDPFQWRRLLCQPGWRLHLWRFRSFASQRTRRWWHWSLKLSSWSRRLCYRRKRAAFTVLTSERPTDDI